jgi:multicomponent Na+:H+ antiporter subunit B
MTKLEDNPITITISSIVSPFIMLFALYVIFHGHYSPGGGFQGGTLLAAAIMLVRLACGSEVGQLQFNKKYGTPLGSLGVLIYFGTGLITMFLGGNFLNYHFLPLAGDPSHHRSMGILFVEIGVGLAVMAILVAIYDDLLEGNP